MEKIDKDYRKDELEKIRHNFSRCPNRGEY